MQLTLTISVAAPAEHVFAEACRFGRFAQAARENGARVRRIDPEPGGRGLRWDVAFPYQGAERQMDIELVERRPGKALRFKLDSASLHGDFAAAFRAAGPERTEVEVTLSVQGKTLKAKLMLQGAIVMKPQVAARLTARLEAIARRAEASWAEAQAGVSAAADRPDIRRESSTPS